MISFQASRLSSKWNLWENEMGEDMVGLDEQVGKTRAGESGDGW